MSWSMALGMFKSLIEQCHAKCINKSHAEGDVSKQEALCLDRCVSKYLETDVQVGENMQKLGQSGQLYRKLSSDMDQSGAWT
ncbi:Tim10/DDP family zinc finger [Metschnikowia aff. pulcherrima]|uniref:Mitochondrial import inner membrane translocase subunit n=1 Tax=Metschnikowia aff. pulcherrima TaxID=2163413 RepID=A0A4P6XVI2_9ASCO|nr:Tim10/DDP family zinc finger [Metschnikowia aff. pulcherrima]